MAVLSSQQQSRQTRLVQIKCRINASKSDETERLIRHRNMQLIKAKQQKNTAGDLKQIKAAALTASTTLGFAPSSASFSHRAKWPL